MQSIHSKQLFEVMSLVPKRRQRKQTEKATQNNVPKLIDDEKKKKEHHHVAESTPPDKKMKVTASSQSGLRIRIGKVSNPDENNELSASSSKYVEELL